MKKIFNKFIVGLFVIILVMSVVGCESSEISFATDLTNNIVVTSPNYSFKASANCGSEVCKMEVRLNDSVLECDDNGGYMASLVAGENTILLTATIGSATKTKSYVVNYRADFDVTTDIMQAEIVNSVIAFSASAKFNDEDCNIVVEHNETTLTKTNDKYSATLIKGENVFVVTAREGENVKTEEYTINYDDFAIITDLTSKFIIEPNLSFRVNGAYGKEACDVVVKVDDVVLAGSGISYSYEFTEEKTSIITITASKDNMCKSVEFEVSYSNAQPYFEMISLQDDKEYKGNILTFDVIAKNGLDQKVDDSALSFALDKNASDGIENYVEIKKGTDIFTVWSDNIKSSFKINFKLNAFDGCIDTPIDLKITVITGGKTHSESYTLTYVGADSDGKIGQVVFALEGFSVDSGFFIEPQYVDIYENKPFSVNLTDMITDMGWTYTYTGQIPKGFYLAGIVGLPLENNKMDTKLAGLLTEYGIDYDATLGKNEDNVYSLSEFDFCVGAGWMYSVNGEYPNYGFSDCYPQDGDVIRAQFTVYYGADLGGGGAMGDGGDNWLTDDPSFIDVYKLLANIKDNDYYGLPQEKYNEVKEKLTEWDISQADMDACVSALQSFYIE